MSCLDRKSFSRILTIFCIALLTISVAAGKMSVESVSLSAHQHISATGVQRGGTVVYISGSGFNANGKGVNVFFGPCECNVIQQESTSNMIACKMTKMMNGKQRQNLPVTVYMENQQPVSCYTKQCFLSFASSLTSEQTTDQVRILIGESPVLKLTCTEANQFINGTVCANCSDDPNSLGTATTNQKACNCLPTYTWSTTLLACLCPKNFILLDGQCYSCANVTTKNGTGKSISNTTCQCKNPTFTFNTDSFSCFCSEDNTFVNSTGSCYSCTNTTTNGTGLVNTTSPKQCACKETYTWNAKINDCTCPNGSIHVNKQSCFACSSLKGKNGTGALLINNTCQCNTSFIFHTENNTCTCPDPQSYIDKLSGNCVPCSGVGNSTLKADTRNKVCICENNFLWNPSKNRTACLCPDNSFITEDRLCVTCTSVKTKNGTGLVSRTNSSSCQCNLNYVYNSTSNACQCPDPQSYVDKATGACIPCSNISNGSGFADPKGRKCICIDSSYVWTPTLKPPACVCLTNSILKLKADNQTFGCYACAQVKTKNGTGLASNSTACACLKNFIFNTFTGGCQCPDANSYIDKLLGCVSCSNIANSNNTAGKNRCNCFDTYSWIPSVNTSSCLCPNNSILLVNQDNSTCFLCTKGKNSTGKVLSTNTSSCQCIKTFVWSPETLRCQCEQPNSYVDKGTGFCIDCATFGNSTGEVNQSTGICACNETFVYTASVKKYACTCPPNSFLAANSTCVLCSGLKAANANGTGNVNKSAVTACECKPSFVYFADNNTCACPDPQSYIDPVSKKCVGCTGAGNVTEEGPLVNFTTKTCICTDPSLVWTTNIKVPACLCPKDNIFVDGVCISCSKDKKTRNLTGSIFNSTVCACLTSFVWNATSFACQCPDPNSYIDNKTNQCVPCTGVGNGTNTSDVNGRKCVCLDTYAWITTTKPFRCLCAPNSIVLPSNGSCFLCTVLKGNNGTGATNGTSACACSKSFAWNAAQIRCQCPFENSFIEKGICLTCLNIGNGSGLLNQSSLSSCACNDTFIWDSKRSTTACLCPPAAILNNETQLCFICTTLSLPNATTRVSSAIRNTCECSRTYIFNMSTNSCHCPNDENSFISTTKLCVSCLNIVNGDGTVNVNSTGCTCNSNYTYSIPLNKCLLSTTVRSASCANDMIWSDQAKSCICQAGFAKNSSNCIKCSSIENSNGNTNSDRTSCICNTGYNWNSNSFSCA